MKGPIRFDELLMEPSPASAGIPVSVLLKALPRHAPICVCFWDRDPRCLRLNESLAEINCNSAQAHLMPYLRQAVRPRPGGSPGGRLSVSVPFTTSTGTRILNCAATRSRADGIFRRFDVQPCLSRAERSDRGLTEANL